ncbi:MAG: deoxyguanosinetriphosphate triphosphohydrolase [Caldisericaceae bacterium]
MRREDFEELEKTLLSPFATLSSKSKGRAFPEEPDTYRTDFQRDVDRILYSKAFRRLQYKTQVFIAPSGDHYRNRLTHTLEVMTISRSISRALRLNPDLTEAIAFGHDLGHSPFGHAGEEALNDKIKEQNREMHFTHTEQSLRVVDYLERRINSEGKTVFGLNLTQEVREGILKHSKGLYDMSSFGDESIPKTLEGQVVRISDRIAYLHHDTDDAMRAGIITEADFPEEVALILGKTNSKRISTLINSTIENSADKDRIELPYEIEKAMDNVKDFLTEKVYVGSAPKKEESKAKMLVSFLFDYYFNKPEKIGTYIKTHPFSTESSDVIETVRNDTKKRITLIADYISSMTDRFARELFESIFIPKSI